MSDHNRRSSNSPTVILGDGELSWPSRERRGNRYGVVGLWPPRGGPQLAFDPPPPVSVHGTLVAIVLETQESPHIGDLARGLVPSTPARGDILVLGTGRLFVQDGCVGLVPDDGRTTDWLDPHALYQAHYQIVRLTFTPSGQP